MHCFLFISSDMQDGKSTVPEMLPWEMKIPTGVASKNETWAKFAMYQ